MSEFKYPLATSSWDNQEITAMHEVIESMQFTMGARVAKYESQFARLFGSENAVMSNSGSSANLLALGAVRYSSSRKDPRRTDVIVPAVSWSTTYFPITQMGFRVKFVDVDLSTLNLSVGEVERAIDDHTAGILAVNLLGNPADLITLRSLAKENNLFFIEDNCESLGAQVDGKYTGTFGDIGTFSSFFSHHISTMEGGMSVTDDLELAQIMTSLRAHGWTRELPDQNFVHNKTGNKFEDYYRFVLPGYNLRPLELEAAIGIEQLKKVGSIVEGRRVNSNNFQHLMSKYPDVLTQEEFGRSSWFGFSMILSGKYSGKRFDLLESLMKHGVESRPIVTGNFTRNPVLKHMNHCEVPQLPNSDKIHFDGLFVGNHHYEMSKEFEFLQAALEDFFG
jgi:CDP-6-deoxy-D-xylo-4-hexulose-3-dehydrase